MNTFIGKNKKWLKFYSTASRILGWTLILFSATKILCNVLAMSLGISELHMLLMGLGRILEVAFGRLPVGVILLGVGQFLKYTYETEYKMPWLLRNGKGLLYLFAILVILRPFIFYLYQHNNMNLAPHLTIISSFFFSILPESLIFVGLGNILKRIMPIIEEQKTLV